MGKIVKELRGRAALCAIMACKEIFQTNGSIESFKRLNKKHALANGMIRPYEINISTERIKSVGGGNNSRGVAIPAMREIAIRGDMETQQIHTFFHEARHNFQIQMAQHIFSPFTKLVLTDYERVIAAYNYICNAARTISGTTNALQGFGEQIDYFCDPNEIDARVYALEMTTKCFYAHEDYPRFAFLNLLSTNLENEEYINWVINSTREACAFANQLDILPREDILFKRMVQNVEFCCSLFEANNIPTPVPFNVAVKIFEKALPSAKKEFGEKIQWLKNVLKNMDANQKLPNY